MKGKIAFVFGAAVGYVFGSRAGRERYEQIKRGARTVWNSAPVQKQVTAAKTATVGRLGKLGLSVVNAVGGRMKASGEPASSTSSPASGAAPGSTESGES